MFQNYEDLKIILYLNFLKISLRDSETNAYMFQNCFVLIIFWLSIRFLPIQGPVIIASAQGGMNIEDVAAESPEALMTMPVDIYEGLQRKQAEEVANFIGFDKDTIDEVRKFAMNK